MSRRTRLLAAPILALTLALGALAGPVLQPLDGAAAQAQPEPGEAGCPRTVTVGGEGRVAVRPDLAYVVFGVDTVNADIAQALAENGQRMTTVLDTLKARGLQDRDLQTTGFSVSPQADREGRPAGYRVSNGVRATVRDVAALGPILEATVAAGATSVRGIGFDLSNKEEAVYLAREAAIQDARDRAEQYARFAGVELGAPVSITEVTSPARPAAAPAAGGGPVPTSGGAPPVQTGEGFIVVVVQAIYELR